VAISDADLLAYWDANPGSMDQSMLNNPEEWGLTPYANEGQTTGYWDDGSAVTFYDPGSQSYLTEAIDPSDPFAFKNENNLGYYQNDQGDYVYGVMPTSIWGGDGSDDTTYQEGVDPNWQPRSRPDMNGIGGDVQLDDQGNIIGRGDNYGGQRDPFNTPIVPEGGTGGIGDFYAWQGSDSHDQQGNVIAGGPADPNSRPVYNRGDPWVGSNPWVNPTVSGAQNVDNITEGGPINTNNPLQGYESSSNKDFYQQQFQDLRARQIRQGQAQQDAANYQAPEPQPIGDPWESFNLPEVFVAGAQEGYDPNQLALNPAYAGMDNSQIVSQLSNQQQWTDEDQRWLQDYLGTGVGNDNYSFIGDREGEASRIAEGGYSDQNKGRLTDVLNTIWQPQGQLPTPGGQIVPQGYASPTNA
jgi:hypothetical protein